MKRLFTLLLSMLLVLTGVAPVFAGTSYNDTYTITIYSDIPEATFVDSNDTLLVRHLEKGQSIGYVEMNIEDLHFELVGYTSGDEKLGKWDIEDHIPNGDEEWHCEWKTGLVAKFYHNANEEENEHYYATYVVKKGERLGVHPSWYDPENAKVTKSYNTKADGSGTDYTPREVEAFIMEEDIELYVQWADAWKVTYDAGEHGIMQYGNDVPENSVELFIEKGESVVPEWNTPEMREESDLVFMGWTYNGQLVEGSFTPESDVTLVATYEKANIIKFHANSPHNDEVFALRRKQGEAIDYYQYFDYGNGDQFIIVKWNTEPDGSGESYEPYEQIRDFVPTGDMDLYGVWQAYNAITFHSGNEGYMYSWERYYGEEEVETVYETEQTSIVPVGEEEAILWKPDVRDGFDVAFVGWYTDPSLGEEYRITEERIVPIENMDLYAKWVEAHKVTIYANATDAMFEHSDKDVLTLNVAKGEQVGINPYVYREDEHFELVGFTKGDETIGRWDLSEHVPEGDEEWYCKWKERLIVNFYRNSDADDDRAAMSYFDQGDELWGAPDWPMQGRVITSYNTRADGTGEAFELSDLYGFVIDKDYTFYAQWSDAWNVRISAGQHGYMYEDAEVGTVNSIDRAVVKGESIELDDYEPYANEDSEYVFDGWICNGEPVDNVFTPEEDVEVVAQWKLPVVEHVHDWNEAIYTWEGTEKVTASRTCKDDETHVETETVETTLTVTKATFDAIGRRTYTAKFTNEAFETQTRSTALNNLVVLGLADKTYTGKAHTQNIIVGFGDETLVKDKDYTVEYSMNTNPGTAQVTIKAVGDLYDGTKVATFKIVDPNGAKLPDKYTGLIKASDGKYRYYKEGVFQSKYTGLYLHSGNNKYYFLSDGVWRSGYTGLYVHSKNGNTYYLKGGIWQNGYDGLYQHSSNKKFYYLKNGLWQKNYVGLYKHSINGNYYYLKGGIWQRGYDGLYVHSINKWTYYLRNGVWNRVSEWYKHSTNGMTYYIETGLWRGRYRDKSGVEKKSTNVVIP